MISSKLNGTGRVHCTLGAILTVLLLSPACQWGKPKSVRLRLRFVPGEEYTYRYTSHWEGRIESPGQPPRTFTRREDSEIIRIVESLDPRTMVATLREIASAHARESLQDSTTNRSWVREMTMRVGQNGEVVAIDGLDRKEGFGGQWYFEKLLAQALPVFPDEPVEPGHSWTQKRLVDLANGEQVTAEASFVFRGIRSHQHRRCAVLEEGNHLFIPFQEEGDLGMDESSGKGEMLIDLDRGILIQEKIEREVQPKRWTRVLGRQILQQARTVYHSSESLDLVAASTRRP